MKQAAVLALDLATTTGWALHAPGMERPFFDAFMLPGGSHAVGIPCLALRKWLEGMHETFASIGGISHFFFEDQHIGANTRSAYRLIGLGAHVETFVAEINEKAFAETGDPDPIAKAYCVGIGEWRKHFLGRGGGFKRDKTKKGKPYEPGQDPKEIAVQRCAQYGWHTDIHDAAEACGILDFGLSLIPDYHRPWRDRVLMGGSQ